jgi:hypothetical protein
MAASGADQPRTLRMDIETVRDQLSRLAVAGDIVAIEQDGRTIGYFVPVKSKDSPAAQRARARLEQAIAEARAAGAFDEEALSAALNLKDPA